MTEAYSVTDLFERHEAAIGVLQKQVPELFALLRGHVDVGEEREAWSAFASAPVLLRMEDRRPTLVAVLAGPSGAGKSTVFSLLTGIHVPAGNDVRPMSRSSALAVPRFLLDAQRLTDLMPGCRFELLNDPERLREQEVPDDMVFYGAYSTPSPDADIALILADIPDFNTVERSNWEKAERMIDRADVVLFTVYPEGYKDERTIAILRRCCRSAGYLACLFTKTTRQAARRIWDDLKAFVSTDEAFGETRHDGRTLAEFVARAPAYSSPYRETPGIDEMLPLDEGAPGFASLLWGLKGAAILLERRSQAVQQGVRTAVALCDHADRRAEGLAKNLAEIDRSTEEVAELVAGAQFPVGRMLQLIMETANEARPPWLRAVTMPLSLLAKGVLVVGRRVSRLMAQVRSRAIREEIPDRSLDSLEQERLAKGVERLINHWRDAFPEERAGRLNTEACQACRDAFSGLQIPAGDSTWDLYVKDRIRDWMNEVPRRKRLLPLAAVANDLLIALGGVAAVVDYATLGGWGTTGIVTAVAGGSMLAGVLLKLFEEMNLRAQLVDADRRWRELRSERMAEHLRKNLANPLLRSAWEQEHNQLVQLTPACRRACADLEKLGEELSHA